MRRNDDKGLSLFSRMLIAFLAVVTLVSGALTWAFYVFSMRSIEQHTAENILQQFKAIEYHFGFETRVDMVKDLRILASNPVLDDFIMSSPAEREVGARAVERLFLGAMKYHESYQGVYFTNTLGREQVRVDRSGRVRKYRDLSAGRLFTRVKAGTPGGVEIVGPWKDSAGRVVASIGIHKVDHDIGQFGGALFIDWSFDRFIEYLSKIKIFDANLIWLFSRDGTVLMRPRTTGEVFDPRPYLSNDVQIVPRLLLMKEGMVVYQDLSVFPGNPLVRLAIGVPSSLLLTDVRSALKLFSAMFLLALLITFIIALYLSRYLSGPITVLAAAAARLAKGDLSTQVAVRASGEVRRLVDSFNRMAADLQHTTVSKEHVDNIINSMIDTLIVISPEGKILQANAAACALLGYKEEELLGQGMELIFKEAAPQGRGAMDELIATGSVGSGEQIYIAKDGRAIPVLFSGATMRDGDNAIQGLVCVAQDITDRKHAEEQLKSFAVKLQKSNKELEEFAYVASHDLQEPLRKVTAFGEQLKTKYGQELGEKGGDYLERMQGAARRMQGLITNLLSYSRVTTKAQPYVPVDLGTVAQEVLSDLEVRIEQTKGRVDVGDLPTIDADPLQMRQLFQNLIGNALKFHRTGEPPVVTIRSSVIVGNGTEGAKAAAGALCRITFADNGIGFEEKDVDRVFGVFQRLHGRSEYEGTGIGLAICRKLVERHGGTITAKSEPGQGTVFTAELPVAHTRGERADE
ncbi:MAG: hypothetical protein A2X56_08790 [Nitrospirae bacterium GWC2_57_13]|jgi:PAS domain S-box-containing protein|nr:MAG: hypothetical protein A2X56_08790 [Nitrospirae bacterium GWC2_57_13]OGW42277.1 MAG: hypothetical protein A2X57_02510 [Nitrospirae bacterium GWD2_57_8]